MGKRLFCFCEPVSSWIFVSLSVSADGSRGFVCFSVVIFDSSCRAQPRDLSNWLSLLSGCIDSLILLRITHNDSVLPLAEMAGYFAGNVQSLRGYCPRGHLSVAEPRSSQFDRFCPDRVAQDAYLDLGRVYERIVAYRFQLFCRNRGQRHRLSVTLVVVAHK